MVRVRWATVVALLGVTLTAGCFGTGTGSGERRGLFGRLTGRDRDRHCEMTEIQVEPCPPIGFSGGPVLPDPGVGGPAPVIAPPAGGFNPGLLPTPTPVPGATLPATPVPATPSKDTKVVGRVLN